MFQCGQHTLPLTFPHKNLPPTLVPADLSFVIFSSSDFYIFFLLLKKAHFLSWFFWIFIRLLIASTWKNQFSDFCQPGVRNVDFPSDPPLEIAFCSCTRWPVIKGICHPSLYSLILSGDSFQWIGRYDVFASCNANAEICQDSIPKNEMLQNKNSMAGDLTLILFSVVFF